RRPCPPPLKTGRPNRTTRRKAACPANSPACLPDPRRTAFLPQRPGRSRAWPFCCPSSLLHQPNRSKLRAGKDLGEVAGAEVEAGAQDFGEDAAEVGLGMQAAGAGSVEVEVFLGL